MNEKNKAQNTWTSITPHMAKKWMDTMKQATVVDVRSEEEFALGHIPGAINLVNETITELPEELPDLNTPVLLYCHSGRRSKEAAEKLCAIGYRHVYEFGGLLTWPYELVGEEQEQEVSLSE